MLNRYRLGGCLCLALLLVICVMRVSGQNPENRPATPEEQAKVKAAKEMARASAKEGTPDYFRAFDRALAVSRGEAVGPATGRAFGFGDVNEDSDYGKNYSAMLDDRNDRDRIFGGRPVEDELAYPDVVAIVGNDRLCTGTLIAPNAVLTAAHCVCRGVTDRVYFGNKLLAPSRVVDVDKTRARAMVDCDNTARADIGLLMLKESVNVTPRTIASAAAIDAARDMRAVGFGKTEKPAQAPAGIKREVDVPVASTSCLGKVDTPWGPRSEADFYRCTPQHDMVAGAHSLNRDTCYGDSGGPIFVRVGDALLLAGATSRPTGQPGVRECGDGGVYARIDDAVLRWLAGLGVVLTSAANE